MLSEWIELIRADSYLNRFCNSASIVESHLTGWGQRMSNRVELGTPLNYLKVPRSGYVSTTLLKLLRPICIPAVGTSPQWVLSIEDSIHRQLKGKASQSGDDTNRPPTVLSLNAPLSYLLRGQLR